MKINKELFKKLLKESESFRDYVAEDLYSRDTDKYLDIIEECKDVARKQGRISAIKYLIPQIKEDRILLDRLCKDFDIIRDINYSYLRVARDIVDKLRY